MKSTKFFLYNMCDLFINKLTDAFFAEKECQMVLHNLTLESEPFDLHASLQQALILSEQHISRLESIFTSMNEEIQQSASPTIKHLFSSCNESCSHCKTLAVYNACLITNFQHILHYKISLYGSLTAFAKELGLESAARHLLDCLNDDKKLDQKLSEIAITVINHEAL